MTTVNQTLRHVVLPIRVSIDPMERLLVASFKGDPEFEAFEPQVFDDPINGKGMRVPGLTRQPESPSSPMTGRLHDWRGPCH